MMIDFGGVLDVLPGLVWTTEADGRCDFVNRGWGQYTGLELEKAIDHGWQAAIHPDDLSPLMWSWDLIKQSGAAKEIDVRLRRFDGEYRWFVFRSSPSHQRDQRNQRWCWLGLAADESETIDGRLRRLLDMLPIQAGFMGPSGASEYANRQTLTDYGMTQEELRQWTMTGWFHPDDDQELNAHLTPLLTTGKTFDASLRMRYKDGNFRWTRALAVPCRDAQGNVVRYFTCQIDVTELKRAEALLAAEVMLLETVARGERLRQILDALSLQAETLCSACICSILVVAPDRKHFELAAGPNLPDEYNAIFDGKIIDGGCDPSSLAVIEKAPIVSKEIGADPRWKGSVWPSLMDRFGYSSCWSMPIMSASNEVSGIFAIYRREPVSPTTPEQELIDRFTKIAGIAISRAQADEALQARERDLREAYANLELQVGLLQQLPVSAWTLKPDGTFDFVNQIWLEFSGQTLDFVRSHPEAWMAAVHPEDREMAAKSFWEGVRSGQGFSFETRSLRAKDGSYRRHLQQAVVLHDGEGKVLRFVGTTTDIDDQKRAEETLRQAQSELAHVARVATLNAMTASIAHEVSQPLSGILTNANTGLRMLAAEPPNVAGAVETARRTIRDANRASEVVKRLRAMFSKEGSAMELVDLNDAAREVITLSASELQRRGAFLKSALADNLPLVSGDRVQLQQVILNLLLNAADAMTEVEDRPRTILVQTGLHDGGSVKLAVRDSGVGVDPNAVEKLFEAFYTTKPNGMGVGLSVCRSIIKRHDGRLWVEANDGPGATFSFCIPSTASDRA
jgi:PAS domain S-box-containing protein